MDCFDVKEEEPSYYDYAANFSERLMTETELLKRDLDVKVAIKQECFQDRDVESDTNNVQSMDIKEKTPSIFYNYNIDDVMKTETKTNMMEFDQEEPQPQDFEIEAHHSNGNGEKKTIEDFRNLLQDLSSQQRFCDGSALYQVLKFIGQGRGKKRGGYPSPRKQAVDSFIEAFPTQLADVNRTALLYKLRRLFNKYMHFTKNVDKQWSKIVEFTNNPFRVPVPSQPNPSSSSCSVSPTSSSVDIQPPTSTHLPNSVSDPPSLLSTTTVSSTTTNVSSPAPGLALTSPPATNSPGPNPNISNALPQFNLRLSFPRQSPEPRQCTNKYCDRLRQQTKTLRSKLRSKSKEMTDLQETVKRLKNELRTSRQTADRRLESVSTLKAEIRELLQSGV